MKIINAVRIDRLIDQLPKNPDGSSVSLAQLEEAFVEYTFFEEGTFCLFEIRYSSEQIEIWLDINDICEEEDAGFQIEIMIDCLSAKLDLKNKKSLITVEDLYIGSPIGNMGYGYLSKRFKGVITPEEALQRMYRENGRLTLIRSDKDKVFSFVDLYGFGAKILPKEWRSWITTFPYSVPRSVNSNGEITTMEEYIFTYFKDYAPITSNEELLTHLNSIKGTENSLVTSKEPEQYLNDGLSW